jgi:glycosyltransferase involved in cell wall biosynthesis
MGIDFGKDGGPPVTLLIPTFNRRDCLGEAVGSAVRQSWRNLQIIVANDGGADVRDIVESFNDPRILLLQRAENRGKAVTLNEALQRAEGKHIAYLDDDDLHYPDHIRLLAEALEGPTDCQVAYTNLYRTTFRHRADGKRLATSKLLEIRRDFDRCFMFHFNHVLHCSVMHRKDLLGRTGPYNENIRVLIDWDMTRRLAFFSDFLHVERITGEYCIPAEKTSDRISYRMRQDRDEFFRQLTTIRTTRPAKPWPKVQDLSIILAPPRIDAETVKTVGHIINKTFWPYLVYLVLTPAEAAKLDTSGIPKVIETVLVGQAASYEARVDAALARCQGEIAAIVPMGLAIEEMWVEWPLYVLTHVAGANQAVAIPRSGDFAWGVVGWREDLLRARREHPALSVPQSLEKTGITVTQPRKADFPLAFDEFLSLARSMEQEGNWTGARVIFEKMPAVCDNELWMSEQAARALYLRGTADGEAIEHCRKVNTRLPSASSLLLEARLQQRCGRIDQAVELLEEARDILRWKG